MKSNLKTVIQRLEASLLLPEVRKSKIKLAALLSNDFLEFGASGKTHNKKLTLRDLPKETASHFSIQNFNTKKLSNNVVLATYRVKKTSRNKVVRSLRSSIWLKSAGTWHMIFHQGTREK